jgi:hypothetical protein
VDAFLASVEALRQGKTTYKEWYGLGTGRHPHNLQLSGSGMKVEKQAAKEACIGVVVCISLGLQDDIEDNKRSAHLIHCYNN